MTNWINIWLLTFVIWILLGSFIWQLFKMLKMLIDYYYLRREAYFDKLISSGMSVNKFYN